MQSPSSAAAAPGAGSYGPISPGGSLRTPRTPEDAVGGAPAPSRFSRAEAAAG